MSDQFEQDRGFRLILADVGDVIEDQEMVLVELVVAAASARSRRAICEFLDQIRGPGEQDAPAVLDKGKAQSRHQMTFSGARRCRGARMRRLPGRLTLDRRSAPS